MFCLVCCFFNYLSTLLSYIIYHLTPELMTGLVPYKSRVTMINIVDCFCWRNHKIPQGRRCIYSSQFLLIILLRTHLCCSLHWALLGDNSFLKGTTHSDSHLTSNFLSGFQCLVHYRKHIPNLGFWLLFFRYATCSTLFRICW